MTDDGGDGPKQLPGETLSEGEGTGTVGSQSGNGGAEASQTDFEGDGSVGDGGATIGAGVGESTNSSDGEDIGNAATASEPISADELTDASGLLKLLAILRLVLETAVARPVVRLDAVPDDPLHRANYRLSRPFLALILTICAGLGVEYVLVRAITPLGFLPPIALAISLPEIARIRDGGLKRYLHRLGFAPPDGRGDYILAGKLTAAQPVAVGGGIVSVWAVEQTRTLPPLIMSRLDRLRQWLTIVITTDRVPAPDVIPSIPTLDLPSAELVTAIPIPDIGIVPLLVGSVIGIALLVPISEFLFRELAQRHLFGGIDGMARVTGQAILYGCVLVAGFSLYSLFPTRPETFGAVIGVGAVLGLGRERTETLLVPWIAQAITGLVAVIALATIQISI